ncbi:hypothetical protein MIND_00114900 [Mycena indigotica]|uniref:Uncharacterized protein n=1 Tax=Mycena indigotica TaxID=2126181 RepID=A0A8H6TEW1_9AGAR|nr:uncharacterized protein MIND_00114900 [Mycena indigotica]KAF7315979.1 hypothetical protein MIND_00114900 [Mycena indigotica]
MGRRRRSATSKETNLLHLPPEICALICHSETTEPKTLLQLSRLSHSFRYEAQRLIYRVVDLRTSSKPLAWARAVTHNPRLGTYVQRFTLSPSPDLAVAAKIARALRNCPNIKRLAAQTAYWSPDYNCADDVTHTWIIDNAPFQLTHFSNSSLRNSFLHPFWNKQTEIQVLSLPLIINSEGKRGFPCREDQLPKLIALDVASTNFLPATPRPLQRIQIGVTNPMPNAHQNLRALRRFAATLTVFNFSAVAIELMETISVVSQAAPNLQHLGLSEKLSRTGFDHSVISDFVPCPLLQDMKHLRSFVLYTYTRRRLVLPANTSIGTPEGDHFVHANLNAEALLRVCPALDQVVVGTYVKKTVDDTVSYTEKTCKVTRVSGDPNRYLTQTGKGFDLAAMGRFWDI